MLAMALRSVRQKLLLTVLVANVFALAAAGGALLYYDLSEHRANTAAALTTLAGILGQGSAVALEFDDPEVARENLALLSAYPNILAAAIYTADNQLFAAYGADKKTAEITPFATDADGFLFEDGALVVYRQIATPNGKVGSVYLKERFNLSAWLKGYLMILGVILALSLTLGLAISTRLQRWISRPIQAVSAVAHQVMAQRNYRLRAVKSTEDEIGHLADAFNGMLEALEHEIAERSTAEQEVRMLNTELEQRVIDRTAELQIVNQRLTARTHEAEAANRAKADFLANMSHEIRTPMNAILGFAYLLEQSPLDSNASDLVKKIRNAGRSLQSIINEILDLSKIEAGKLELERTPFTLDDVLDSLASIMAANVGDKDIDLVISPSPVTGRHLLGDAFRLEQILFNLASNAIKFTEQGSVAVDIDVLSQSEEQVQLRFSVRDTGIGIPQKNQRQIFSAFTQADISTTRRFGGTGLGLTICRHLVTAMGGEIGVVSEAGEGSEFWFTLPFQWSSEPADESVPTRFQLLIVDSHPASGNNLARIAHSLSWNSVWVESGAAAIDQVRSSLKKGKNFDVILLDSKIDQSWCTVARELTELMEKKPIPVILMMPALPSEQQPVPEDRALLRGILHKPVTGSALYNMVVEVTRTVTATDAGQQPPAQPRGRRLKDINVLVVDDNAVNREVAMRFLQSESADVQLANDGKAAVDWVENHPDSIDVILMDVQMPVMDGYDATRHIRALPHGRDLPVIALTAGVFNTHIDAAREAGMNGFIAKPFKINELVDAIRGLLRTG